MRPSRGMGAIKKTKIPSATENTMPKGVVKKRRDNTDFTQFKKGGAVKSIDKLAKQEIDTSRIGKKEGGPVGLYANINARKKAGTSRPKSKSTISPKAYANMKAGFPKGKK
jgi:hypothetical protein